MDEGDYAEGPISDGKNTNLMNATDDPSSGAAGQPSII